MLKFKIRFIRRKILKILKISIKLCITMFKHNLLKKNLTEEAEMADELRERNSSSHFSF